MHPHVNVKNAILQEFDGVLLACHNDQNEVFFGSHQETSNDSGDVAELIRKAKEVVGKANANSPDLGPAVSGDSATH